MTKIRQIRIQEDWANKNNTWLKKIIFFRLEARHYKYTKNRENRLLDCLSYMPNKRFDNQHWIGQKSLIINILDSEKLEV